MRTILQHSILVLGLSAMLAALAARHASAVPQPMAASAPPPASAPQGRLHDPHRELHLPDAIPPLPHGTKVVVGTCDLPPWSMRPASPDEEWKGIAMHLMREIARDLDLQVDLRIYAYGDLLDALERGEVDIAATGIPVTATNLSRFTMTPAFDESGISIATHTQPPLTFWSTLRHISTPQVQLWAGTLAMACVIFGGLLWLVERKRNPPFEGRLSRALAESSWWSVVTMFTVGYGDRVPVTLRGKLVAVIWMATSFVLITVASALVTSALTVQQLRPVVANARDLASARVGCVKDTDGESFCASTDITPVTFPAYESAIAALESGRVDAVVGSSAALGFLVGRSHVRTLVVLPQKLRNNYVAFGERYGLPVGIEKHLELEMLKAVQSDAFRHYRDALLGEQSGIEP